MADEIRKHRTAADDLWVTREKYVSLLTDLDTLSEQEIREVRDQLQTRTAEIYKLVPATDAKSYKAAEKALKNEEKHFFTSDEIDRILPEHLRKNLLKTKLHEKS